MYPPLILKHFHYPPKETPNPLAVTPHPPNFPQPLAVTNSNFCGFAWSGNFLSMECHNRLSLCMTGTPGTLRHESELLSFSHRNDSPWRLHCNFFIHSSVDGHSSCSFKCLFYFFAKVIIDAQEDRKSHIIDGLEMNGDLLPPRPRPRQASPRSCTCNCVFNSPLVTFGALRDLHRAQHLIPCFQHLLILYCRR